METVGRTIQGPLCRFGLDTQLEQGARIDPHLLREICDRQLSLGIDIYVDYDEHPVQ